MSTAVFLDSGTTAIPDGTVALPSVRFATDQDSGFYKPAVSQIGVAIDGVRVGLFTSAGITVPGINLTGDLTLSNALTVDGAFTLSTFTSGSVLFTGAGGLVSQDNPNLFWDNTNNSLGVGTTAPFIVAEGNEVAIIGPGTSAANIDVGISVAGGPANTIPVGAINFVATGQVAGQRRIAAIRGETDGNIAGQRGGRIVFATKVDDLATFTDRLRITSDGTITALGIVDITAGGLRVKGQAASPAADAANIGGVLTLAAGGNAGANNTNCFVDFFRTSTRQGVVGFDSDVGVLAGVAKAAADLLFYVNGAYRGFWDASDTGRLVLGNGLRLQGGALFNGATSGLVTLTVAAAAGTWTFTLPVNGGLAGQQLQTDGAGVTSWEAAASSKAVKELLGPLDPEVALERMVHAPVYRFRYRREARGVGGDYETEFAGVVSDEAPWAMMHGGSIFSPISAFGHAAAAIQALQQQVQGLQRRLAGEGV